jgi:S1-C subfamily serine protease
LPSATNSFAHSVAWTRHVVDDIIETGSVHHGWLGVMTTDAPEGGATIESVTHNGPADRAGLIAGDRITSLSEANLATSSALVVALRNHAANDTVTIGYVRNGTAARTFAKLIDRS